MQTLRKKNSPCKFKNEPTRFLGEGVSFKAKLIGILEVSEARGDRMCQAALADLKMAIRAAGEHKQRIAVQVSIEGLRLRDEKTGDCLYHHPVHKISFIAQDMSDSRAFGYIFGSPDTGHRFFGIKTDKAASQVVLAMRDLFQVVFDLKKKEIELAKQHIEQSAIKFRSGIFVEPAPDTKGAAGSEVAAHRIRALNSEIEKPVERKSEVQGGVIADLLDLQFELNSLQQGIHQMDKITPDNPRPPSEDPFETDPFGDSFANMKVKETVQPMLPPPPSSMKRGYLERQQTVPATTTSAASSPATILASRTPPPQGSIHWFDKETENLFNEGELSSLASKASSVSTEKDRENISSSVTPTLRKSPQIDVFTELDPLGTGLIKPYVDKKDFFQHLKNPPKKVLKDLVTTTTTTSTTGDTFAANFDSNCGNDSTETTKSRQQSSAANVNDGFDDDNFADFKKLKSGKARRESSSTRGLHHQPLSVSLPPEETTTSVKNVTSTGYAIPSASTAMNANNKIEKETTEGGMQPLVRLPSPKKYLQSVRKNEFDIDLGESGRARSLDKPFPVDFTSTNDSPASPLRSGSSDANSRLSSSSAELDIIPEPPPRGAGSILINPPPLPPKKQNNRNTVKPPPRPPHTEEHFHYDFVEREESNSPLSSCRDLRRSPGRDSFRNRFDDDFSPPPPQIPKRSELIATFPTSKFEDFFATMTPTTLSSLLQRDSPVTTSSEPRKTKPSLDITLSQLTSTNLEELANSLGMTITELTSLTLQQLTDCLARLTATDASSRQVETRKPEPAAPVTSKPRSARLVETSFVFGEPTFKADFDRGMKQTENNAYDKYAVFRELLEMEQQQQQEEATRTDEQLEEGSSTEPEAEVEQEREPPSSPEGIELEIVDGETETVCSLANLTVSLPPTWDESKTRNVEDEEMEAVRIEEQIIVDENPVKESEPEVVDTNRLEEEVGEDEKEDAEKETDSNESEKIDEPMEKEESSNDVPKDKSEITSSASASSDRYAALREIIEATTTTTTEKPSNSLDEDTEETPVQTTKSGGNDIDLMSLFSGPIPKASATTPSPKRTMGENGSEALNVIAMDIFEEIKMLNSEASRKTEVSPGFEDTFSPFPEMKVEKEENKDDSNWAKFDTNVFHSDKSSGEGAGSVGGGTSPWSPDAKEFRGKEPSFKPAPVNRHSGDSDNEWKDEEESEGSNGRVRDDGFWGGGKPTSRHPSSLVEDGRSYYEGSSSAMEKSRGFRERAGRKSRGSLWGKMGGHRPRDPSPWHEEGIGGRWEEDGRRYPQRKVPYKDDEESYNKSQHWKCRTKQPKQRPWSGDREGFWPHDHPSYDEERKRRMMLWSEEDRDRFSSQESMGYEDEERWSRRWSNEYERRRWEEEGGGRFWGRRGIPPDAEYPYRESSREPRDVRDARDARDPRDPRDPRESSSYRKHEPHYCRDGRYPPPSSWEDEYGNPELAEDAPRYSTSSRKRPWPKRPSSATESRNSEVYSDPRLKYGVSRSECSDNDSDPYHHPRRSRSRESYWGSDQEFEGWMDRSGWSEATDIPTKTETLHRRRMNRHKGRPHAKSQSSPFEDDFTQGVDHPDEASPPDPFAGGMEESRLSAELEPKIPDPVTPVSPRGPKEGLRREPRSRNRTSYRHSPFEDDLTPTPSISSDTSDRQRLSADLKATPEEMPRDPKDPLSADGFVSEDSGRDSFFNGDPRFDDDAFAFKSELEDSVPERATTLPLKNTRQLKSGSNKMKSDQYIKKSESVNIFVRESDPFDDDDFFN